MKQTENRIFFIFFTLWSGKDTSFRIFIYFCLKFIAMADYRRLYRSRTDRKIAGVCGGLAQYLNVDPTVVRIIFLVLLFIGGGGLLIYLII